MKGFAQEFTDTFIAEVKRRIMEESWERIQICLSHLSEEEIWWRANERTNPIGNILLHLCGNLRQWVLSGLDKAPDIRQRQNEFDEQGPIPKAALLIKMENLLQDVEVALDRVTPETLLKKHPVQVYEESGVSILTHVTEHFSYHVGQITYFVKMRKNVDTAYYGGQDLG